jgi:hypothetical protein
MKKELQIPLLDFIDTISTFKGWHNIGEPLIYTGKKKDRIFKAIFQYFDDSNIMRKARENKYTSHLIEILYEYDEAVDDDWLPDYVVALPTKQAYFYLLEIKRIILTAKDEDIEEELRIAYDKIADTL